MIAPDNYMYRPPMPSAFLFVFDTSQAANADGFLQSAVSSIKTFVESMAFPGLPRTMIGILTFDVAVHYY